MDEDTYIDGEPELDADIGPLHHSALPEALDEQFQLGAVPPLPVWALQPLIRDGCTCKCSCSNKPIFPCGTMSVAELLLALATLQDEGNIPDVKMEPFMAFTKMLLPKSSPFHKYGSIDYMKQILGGQYRAGLRLGRKLLYCPGDKSSGKDKTGKRCQRTIPQHVINDGEWPYTCGACGVTINSAADACIRIECNITAQVAEAIHHVGPKRVGASTHRGDVALPDHVFSSYR